MIRIMDVMTIGETPAKQRTNKERRLFRIAAMITVPLDTPLVPVPVEGQAGGVVQVGPRLGGGGGGRRRRRRRGGCGVTGSPGATSADGQPRVAALSFGGELPAVVQQEAARDENDGTREGERHGQSSGWWCIVGRRNQWASSSSPATLGQA
jgi:hypothetical protein